MSATGEGKNLLEQAKPLIRPLASSEELREALRLIDAYERAESENHRYIRDKVVEARGILLRTIDTRGYSLERTRAFNLLAASISELAAEPTGATE